MTSSMIVTINAPIFTVTYVFYLSFKFIKALYDLKLLVGINCCSLMRKMMNINENIKHITEKKTD